MNFILDSRLPLSTSLKRKCLNLFRWASFPHFSMFFTWLCIAWPPTWEWSLKCDHHLSGSSAVLEIAKSLSRLNSNWESLQLEIILARGAYIWELDLGWLHGDGEGEGSRLPGVGGGSYFESKKPGKCPDPAGVKAEWGFLSLCWFWA